MSISSYRKYIIGIIGSGLFIALTTVIFKSMNILMPQQYFILISFVDSFYSKITITMLALFFLVAVVVRIFESTFLSIYIRKFSTALIVMVILGGSVFNIVYFRKIDQSDLYHLRAQTSPILAELASSMADKYPAMDLLVWLRHHAAGSQLHARIADLQSAGLAYHRLIGVSLLEIHACGTINERPKGINDVQKFESYQIYENVNPILIDVEKVRLGSVLCATTMENILVISGNTSGIGCEVH